jgi:lysophospholipase L1-like esterase
MKKEWLMASAVALLTLTISLLLLRSFAPKLLGIPVDLQMVQVSEEVPPFFENAFRQEDLQSKEFIIKDPYSGVRAKPLVPNQEMVGPNDVFGFRNHAVPNVADVVVIGDSQTYGNNSQIQLNWPSQMSTELNKRQKTVVYNMSVGGWGAVQYLYAATKATVFQPRVIVVAFYTGNDPLDSFKLAYNYDVWKELIPDPSLSASDMPKVKFPPPDSELWKVKFSDGTKKTFSPKLRYASNMDHPAVKSGYSVMAKSAQMIASMAHSQGIKTVFTIIPTKELVYEKKISADNIAPQQGYGELVEAEKSNITALAQEILKIEHASYVDVVSPLQEAALTTDRLYPRDRDGHPLTAGYQVIANTISKALPKMIPERTQGFAIMELSKGKYKPVLINQEGYWYFSGKSDRSLIEKNGWDISAAPLITRRDIADLEYAGEISEVRPERFGPQAD